MFTIPAFAFPLSLSSFLITSKKHDKLAVENGKRITAIR